MTPMIDTPEWSAPDTAITVLWNDDDRRCVLSWDGARYRLRLLGPAGLVREELAADHEILFDVSRQWRQEPGVVTGRAGDPSGTGN